MVFEKYIFNLFPLEIRATDSYKDTHGRGLLERYSNVFEMELDENYITYVDNFVSNLFDIILMDEDLLIHLGSTLGLPATPTSSTDFYRYLLAWALRIYETKGTKKAYEIYFKLMGFKVEIHDQPLGRGSIYDIDEIYYDHGMTGPEDVENIENFYDEDCDNCSTYDIAIAKIDDPAWVIDDYWRVQFAKIICFLEPINAKLRDYVPLT